MTRKLAFDAICAARWAMQPEWIRTITDIAQRHNTDPRALEQRLGRPLDNTRRATVRDGVATVPLTGPIFPRANLMTELSGATSLAMFARDFTEAIDAANVNAVIIDIESPGGVALGIAEAAEMVRAAAERKPVVAYVGGLAASAAYWIASAAGEIVLHQTAMVGSIGVVTAVPVQEAPGQDGYRDIEVVSSNAPNKRPDPRTDGGLETIRAELDGLEEIFIGQVAAFRGVSAETVRADFGAGGVKIGIAAVNAGMADRLGSYEALLAELQARPAGPPAAPGARAEWGRSLAAAINDALADGCTVSPGVAAQPGIDEPAAHATRHQQEDDTMSLENLTAEQLEADRPDLVAAIRKDAAAGAQDKAHATGLAEGAEAERARITGIMALGEPGCEAVIAECIADPACTAGDAAGKVLAHQRAVRGKALADLKADDPDTPAAPGNVPGDDRPAIAKDPKALAAEARRLMAEAAARGEQLGADEAVALVLQGTAAA